jgi:hypothetical protein
MRAVLSSLSKHRVVVLVVVIIVVLVVLPFAIPELSSPR